MPLPTLKKIFTAGAVLLATPLLAATGDVLTTYTNPAGQPGHGFGYQVTSHGNSIIATAINESSGTVYIIHPETGDLTTLPRPAGVTFGSFGQSLASNGDKLYVADPGATVADRPGAGVVFVYDTLQDTTPLIITQPAGSDAVGFGEAMDANDAGHLVIGAPRAQTPDGFYRGGVFIYAPGATEPYASVLGSGIPQELVGRYVAISNSGKVAISNYTTIFMPGLQIYDIPAGTLSGVGHPAGSSWIGMFGQAITFINGNLYTSETDLLGTREVYRINPDTRLADRTYTADKGVGVPIIEVDGIVATGASNSHIVFLDSDLNLLQEVHVPLFTINGSVLGSLGKNLLVGNPEDIEGKGAVYMVTTPLTPRAAVHAEDWALYQ